MLDLAATLPGEVAGFTAAGPVLEGIATATADEAGGAAAAIHRLALVAEKVRTGEIDRASVDELIRMATPAEGGQ
jgi:hypothetical protein